MRSHPGSFPELLVKGLLRRLIVMSAVMALT
jgi:hypothetical protein